MQEMVGDVAAGDGITAGDWVAAADQYHASSTLEVQNNLWWKGAFKAFRIRLETFAAEAFLPIGTLVNKKVSNFNLRHVRIIIMSCLKN